MLLFWTSGLGDMCAASPHTGLIHGFHLPYTYPAPTPTTFRPATLAQPLHRLLHHEDPAGTPSSTNTLSSEVQALGDSKRVLHSRTSQEAVACGRQQHRCKKVLGIGSVLHDGIMIAGCHLLIQMLLAN